MNDPRRFDVIVTITREGGTFPIRARLPWQHGRQQRQGSRR
jgi:hypothetical protein